MGGSKRSDALLEEEALCVLKENVRFPNESIGFLIESVGFSKYFVGYFT